MLKKNRVEVGRHAKSYNYFQKTQVGSLEGTSPSPITHNELPGSVRETKALPHCFGPGTHRHPLDLPVPVYTHSNEIIMIDDTPAGRSS